MAYDASTLVARAPLSLEPAAMVQALLAMTDATTTHAAVQPGVAVRPGRAR